MRHEHPSLLCILLFILVLTPVSGADLSLWSSGWGITLLPDTLQIPPHLASPTEIHTKGAILSYDTTTVFREFGYHEEGAPSFQGGYQFSLGDSLPLFRLHPLEDDSLGLSLEANWMIPFVTDARWVAMAQEYLINLAVTYSPRPGIAVGVARQHICSHLLERSLFTGGGNFLGLAPSDTDPQHGPMAIRDSIIFSLHVALERIIFSEPMGFSTSCYVDYGYSLPGKDPLNDARYTRPSYMTSRYLQLGAQVTIELPPSHQELGAFYISTNVSYYENSGYTPNTAYALGYILPYRIGSSQIMIDYTVYDGRAVLEEYYGHREAYSTIGIRIF